MIRRARKGDYNEVIRLYGQFVNNPKRYSKYDADSFFKLLNARNAYIYVAEIQNKIVGFITFSVRNVLRYEKPILEVEELYVIPEKRRKGIGRKLLEIALNHARNCEYVCLASGKKWKDGHKFYSALGFDQYAYHYRKRP
jgi:ribosomal protein S18 acetylase RimI-like enzyme